MEDKEVGELWRHWQEFHGSSSAAGDVCKLIRKLVDERAKVLGWEDREGYGHRATRIPLDQWGMPDFILAALEDFSIDPETFK